MLVLPIKKKWYDMILSGEKKEEYRKLSYYYASRFRKLWPSSLRALPDDLSVTPVFDTPGDSCTREVIFRNGYSASSPWFKATCSIRVGTGRPEWGAEEGVQYFVLEIHGLRFT